MNANKEMNAYELNESLARRVLEVVDAGLVSGMGEPKPGFMCVEAAVCFAMGLPHSDEPTCVGSAVRRFKIRLNDSRWSSDAARTNGLRKLAIAQLGSDQISQQDFVKLVAEGCIRRVLPIALRAAASVNPKFADALEGEAKRCETEGTKEAAKSASGVAGKARTDAYADADAAAAAGNAAAYAYAHAAGNAAAGAYAYAAGVNYVLSDASVYAYAYADAYTDAARDNVLNIVADIGLQALIQLNSPGCQYLHLTEAA